MNLEERLGAAMHHDDPAPAMPGALVDRIMSALPTRSARPWWRGSARLLVATVGIAMLLAAAVWLQAGSRPPVTPTATPSPTPTTPSASPSGPGYVPYVIAQLAGTGTSAQAPRTITTPDDCAFLADDWLRSFCALTLRSGWHAIIGPTDPKPDSATWWAAWARAMIDGDSTFCFDGAMRTWVSLGSHLGATPSAGPTSPPVRPIAACLSLWRSTATKGTFTLSDQGPGTTDGPAIVSGPQVSVTVASGAAARAAQGVAPTFDPQVACGVPHDQCDRMLDAVTDVLGARSPTVQILEVRAEILSCPAAASPCPPPDGGQWLGSVLAGQGGNAALDFDVADVAGQLTVVEVPYLP